MNITKCLGFFFIISLLIQPQLSQAQEKIVVYSRNVDSTFLNESVRNILDLSVENFGSYEIVRSDDMEQARAFAELVKGNIDIVIAAPTLERERLAKTIYVPMDRGLLGFRLCMVHNDAAAYSRISSPAQFIQRKLSIGLGSNWPDRRIFEENGFEVISSPVKQSLFSMLQNKRFDCLSRSVNEIRAELDENADKPFRADDQLVFIYPNSDFMFVNPKNDSIYSRVSSGTGLSLENNSYYEIFDKYYSNILLDNGIYERKLIFLSNSGLSPRALSAINRFGVASFVKQLDSSTSLNVSTGQASNEQEAE
jgi:hypothetical protein